MPIAPARSQARAPCMRAWPSGVKASVERSAGRLAQRARAFAGACALHARLAIGPESKRGKVCRPSCPSRQVVLRRVCPACSPGHRPRRRARQALQVVLSITSACLRTFASCRCAWPSAVKASAASSAGRLVHRKVGDSSNKECPQAPRQMGGWRITGASGRGDAPGPSRRRAARRFRTDTTGARRGDGGPGASDILSVVCRFW